MQFDEVNLVEYENEELVATRETLSYHRDRIVFIAGAAQFHSVSCENAIIASRTVVLYAY